MSTNQQMQAAQQQDRDEATRMAAALGLPDDPQPTVLMHQNPYDVTTAFGVAFGDGPNQDYVFGCTGLSQSIQSHIGWGGLASARGGAHINVDAHVNVMSGRGMGGRKGRREGWRREETEGRGGTGTSPTTIPASTVA